MKTSQLNLQSRKNFTIAESTSLRPRLFLFTPPSNHISLKNRSMSLMLPSTSDPKRLLSEHFITTYLGSITWPYSSWSLVLSIPVFPTIPQYTEVCCGQDFCQIWSTFNITSLLHHHFTSLHARQPIIYKDISTNEVLLMTDKWVIPGKICWSHNKVELCVIKEAGVLISLDCFLFFMHLGSRCSCAGS